MTKEEYSIGIELLKEESKSFLNNIDTIPPNIKISEDLKVGDISIGKGVESAFRLFKSKYTDKISASSGPNYYGFVIGGSTPASLLGDWLTSLYDQCGSITDATNFLERETIEQAKNLFNLPSDFDGAFVSGATASSMVNLAVARQWLGKQHGVDISQSGLANADFPIKIYSATPHSSIYKALSILGLGKECLIKVDTLKNREAINANKLEQILEKETEPVIIIGNAGTVNTGDFDDFSELKRLKEKYNFWLHVDGAFGGFAACSNTYNHLIKDWECADSITVDAHKWLNVPYDSAFQFCKYLDLQSEVFQNGNAPYLDDLASTSYINLTPENSRRWRALPIWFSFASYGINGISKMIERCCQLTKKTGNWLNESTDFDLLADIKLNIVCFKVAKHLNISTELFLKELNSLSRVYLTPTQYNGDYAIRIAFSNWSNKEKNVEELIHLINQTISKLKKQ